MRTARYRVGEEVEYLGKTRLVASSRLLGKASIEYKLMPEDDNMLRNEDWILEEALIKETAKKELIASTPIVADEEPIQLEYEGRKGEFNFDKGGDYSYKQLAVPFRVKGKEFNETDVYPSQIITGNFFSEYGQNNFIITNVDLSENYLYLKFMPNNDMPNIEWDLDKLTDRDKEGLTGEYVIIGAFHTSWKKLENRKEKVMNAETELKMDLDFINSKVV